MGLITHKDCDFWTMKDSIEDTTSPTKLFAFMRGERGFAPLIATRSMTHLSDENRIGFFLSKLSNEDPFNAAPNYHTTGWVLYQHEDCLFLEVSSWMQAEPGQQTSWLYPYPQVRDTLALIIDTYPQVKELTFLGSAGFNANLGLDQPEGLTEYDFRELMEKSAATPSSNDSEELDVIFPSPLWLFCHLWILFSESHDAKTVLVPNIGTLVDEENADLLIEWFGGEGISIDTDRHADIVRDLNEMIENVDENALVHAIMDTPRAGNITDESAGMFG